MKLLDAAQPAELPADALLARLRGRRGALTYSGGKAGDTATRDLVAWVYRRLNLSLRKRLHPFLDLLAMRNLVLVMRYSLAGERPLAALLNNSLLAKELKQLVTTPGEPVQLLGRLEAALERDYPFVDGLVATYRSQGPGGVEQQLADGILQSGLVSAREGLIIKTLSYLVDMRNCLMINKLWRWQVSMPPPFSRGGQLDVTLLQRIWARRDTERLNSLSAHLVGESVASASLIQLEQSFLKGLSRMLRRAGRDPLGLAVIVEYLWLSQLAVHNQVLHQALVPGREDLFEEVLLL